MGRIWWLCAAIWPDTGATWSEGGAEVTSPGWIQFNLQTNIVYSERTGRGEWQKGERRDGSRRY